MYPTLTLPRPPTRDSQVCLAGSCPLNPEPLLLDDGRVANPHLYLTTVEQQSPRYLPGRIATSVDCSTKVRRVGCSGTHYLTTGMVELYTAPRLPIH